MGVTSREQVGHVQPTEALPAGQLTTYKDIAAIGRWAAWTDEKENPIDSYRIYFWSARSVDGARVRRRPLSLVNFGNSYFKKVPKILGFPTDTIAGGELWRKKSF